jgi:hypothetical protein
MTRNVIILGCGRSGTSLAAGTLRNSGFYMGENLYSSVRVNPRGSFESPEVVALKDEGLAGQRWLATVPPGTVVSVPADTQRRMARLVRNEPFCLKDPRFSYTLPMWRPYLEGTRFVCVFREPARTAHSILSQSSTVDHLKHVRMSFDRALAVWRCMYTHILELDRTRGDWLFLHYDQLLTPAGLRRLGTHTAAAVDPAFGEARFSRSPREGSITKADRILYEELCRLAAFHPPTTP